MRVIYDNEGKTETRGKKNILETKKRNFKEQIPDGGHMNRSENKKTRTKGIYLVRDPEKAGIDIYNEWKVVTQTNARPNQNREKQQ